jgi:hypothetical protein
LFLEKLKASLEIYGVALHAYVLMAIIFMCSYGQESQPLEFMRHFNIAYTGRTTDGIRE